MENQQLATDLGQHLAVSGHRLGQVLHHGHLTYTSLCVVEMVRASGGGQPFAQHKVCFITRQSQHASGRWSAWSGSDSS